MSSKHGYYLEDLKVGMAAEMTRLVTEKDVEDFATLTGDTNPVHLDEEFAAQTMFKGRIAHGAFVASLLSAVMGTQLPGPGAIFRSLNLSYRGPVRVGDEVIAHAEIAEIVPDKQLVTLECWCKARGKKVVRANAGAWVARKSDET
ncbi:MAG: MaoC family dehydratase [Maricaulaceae bacterium]|jgi:3-hydroxybutyryl-CoA dehydratase